MYEKYKTCFQLRCALIWLNKIIFVNYVLLFPQITDDNYLGFLAGWQPENKPNVILFDQTPNVPLLYKVSHVFTHTQRHTHTQLNAFLLKLLDFPLSS